MFSVSALLILAFASFGLVAVSAWHVSSIVTSLAPPSCTTPGCVVGTSVTDAAVLAATSETCVPSSSCNYGTVTFQVYSAKTGGCSATYSGTGIAGFSATSESTVSVPSALASGSASVASGSFSTTALSPGNYVWIVNYVTGGGGNSWPSFGPECETMILTAPTLHSAPEFPLGSLGMLGILAFMFPALILLRSRFARKVPL